MYDPVRILLGSKVGRILQRILSGKQSKFVGSYQKESC